jgi:hypothetical protein
MLHEPVGAQLKREDWSSRKESRRIFTDVASVITSSL